MSDTKFAKKAMLIFGHPFVGKTTQAKMLAKNFNYEFFSYEEFINEEIKKATKFGLYIRGFIARGKPIPDDVLMPQIKERVIKLYEQPDTTVVFDGFPVTINHAKFLRTMLTQLQVHVDKIFVLYASKIDLVERGQKKMKDQDVNVGDLIDTLMKTYNNTTKKAIEVFNQKPIEIGATEDANNVQKQMLIY